MSGKLVRGLGPIDAAALVVGTIIGTGIFLKTATMAQYVGSPGWVMVTWVVAGLLSLAGALTYAELGALFPEAGGEYVYLREAYGDIPAFLYGWTRFWIASPGTIAAYAVGAATFLSGAINLDPYGGKSMVAIMLIIFFTILNCLHVAFGGALNSLITGIKVLTVFALVVGVTFFAESASLGHFTASEGENPISVSSFGLALLAALWAYDGWNNLPMAAGEIKDPERNIPLSLSLGMFLVLGLYGAANLAYFYALPFLEVVTSNSNQFQDALPVATKAAQTFMGAAGIITVSLAFVFSSLGAMNASILTGARVPYAMAKDGLFIKYLAKLSDKSSVPFVSVLSQSAIAIVLAYLGTFDQLTEYIIFASFIFYVLVTASVFIFRRTHKNKKRFYHVIGYPYVPILFILVSLFILGNTLYEAPKQSGIGLIIIAMGVPFFYVFKYLNSGKEAE